uniref:Amidase domain-containing protein n=1 Tax=Bionectria ochroleuca TaxID=29856 RepID=A0A0B7KEX8_BIOOC
MNDDIEAQFPTTIDQTLDDLNVGFSTGRFSSEDLVRTHLRRIHQVNHRMRCVAQLDPTVLDQAKTLDFERAQANEGNQIATSNLNCTSGSTAFLGAQTGRDASIVSRLRERGVIVLGTSNMTQWGNNRDGEAGNGWSADAGQALGVYHDKQDPWGSSTGSATGTALGLAFAALGTEVRIGLLPCPYLRPANMYGNHPVEGSIVCAAERSNLCGLKPTVGLVSTDLVMVSRRLGSIGPLARCVKDVAAVLDAIAGPCEFDPTTRAIPFSRMPNYMACCQSSSLHGVRIGVPRNAMRGHPPWAVLTGTVEEAFNKSLDILRECGATIVENTDFTAFDEAIMSKCPDVIKSSDFKLRLAQHCASLTVNPNNIRNMQDLVHHTQTDHRALMTTIIASLESAG